MYSAVFSHFFSVLYQPPFPSHSFSLSWQVEREPNSLSVVLTLKLPSPGYRVSISNTCFLFSFSPFLVPPHPFSQVLHGQSLICSSPLLSSTMQARLQLHLQGASLYEGKTLHSFPARATITLSLSSAQLAAIMAHVAWRNTSAV